MFDLKYVLLGFTVFIFATVGAYPVEHQLEEHKQSEYGNYFEGDMILDTFQTNAILFPTQRNGLIKDTYKWPNNTVYYEIDKVFDNLHHEYILKGIREIESKTCIRFRPRTKNVTDYILVTGTSDGCFSAVGHQGGQQILNLAISELETSCFRLATICHEFIHALGFYHQQSATDRDVYVKIIEKNIKPDKLHNFLKYNATVITDYNVKYDYGSVMHYSAYSFSANGEKTIVPIDETVEIGQRIKMSDKDILKLNLMYKCL